MIETILKNIGITQDYTITISNSTFYISELVSVLLNTGNIKDASITLSVGSSALEHWLERHGKYIFKKYHKGKWSLHFTALVGIKLCKKCDQLKPLEEFVRANETHKSPTNTLPYCKNCDNSRVSKYYRNNQLERNLYSRNHYRNNKAYYIAKARKRELDIIYRTPRWANLSKITSIYASRGVGEHVDHIIPLRGETVCGLHVENNLRVISAKENLQKSNKLIEGTEVGSSTSLENYSNH